MRQILYGLSYLHRNNICHRDIKLDNFLLFKKNDVSLIKMIDFGIGELLTDQDHVMDSLIGTPEYVAPEIYSAQYTLKCDIWAVGVAMYILLTGEYPFEAETDLERFENMQN
jgi:calcium-dependent protein kinase